LSEPSLLLLLLLSLLSESSSLSVSSLILSVESELLDFFLFLAFFVSALSAAFSLLPALAGLALDLLLLLLPATETNCQSDTVFTCLFEFCPQFP